jgi:tetratricopeptide (TPR) repeat protein
VAGGIALYVLLHEVLGWTGATVETGLGDKLILALVILVILALIAHWLRRRIFIAEIATPEAEAGETPDEWGKALAARLRNELGSLAALYRTIDEALPARQGRSMRLELAVEDVAGQLENTLGQEISVGSLAMKIPFSGALSRILRLWRGPRLTGTLHREGPEAGGRLVLTADVSGGGRPASFRVTQDDLLEGDRGADEQQKAYALVRQLAFRIVTAMTSAGSPRWEAIQAFTTGLRAYRAVQRAGVNHERELRKAETCFLEALRLDRNFTDCHYNLAIVYDRLGDSAAAEAAFREAIAADPDNPAAHLGLTNIYCNKQDFLRAEVWARQAIVLSPNNVRAWNFVGVAGGLDQVAVRERKVQRTPEEVEAIWEGIVQSFRVAAALAWRDLCRKELTGAVADRCEARRWVAMTFNNVAESYLGQRAARAGGAPAPAEGGPRGAPFLREGLRAEPSKPYLHLALGKALAQAHLPVSAQAPPDRPGRRDALEEALAALYFANYEGLDFSERCHRWMWILQVHCALHALGQSRPAAEKRRAREGVEKDHREGMRRALRCFLDAVAPPQNLVLAATSRGADSRREDYLSELDRLERQLGNLPPVPGQDRRFTPEYLKTLVAVVRAIERASGMPAAIRPLPRRLHHDDRRWAKAQIGIGRVLRELGAEEPASPILIVRRLELAVAGLRDDHQRQVDRQGLESLLARAYLVAAERAGRTKQGRERRLPYLRKALEHATRGVAGRPEDPVRRLILSQVHGALEDFEMAHREREAALNFKFPADLCGDARLLADLETEWRERLRIAGDARERRTALESANRFLERLLGIADNAPRPASGEPAAEGGATRFDHHAGIHLEAGKLAAAEGDWRRAIGHLRIAVASGHRLPESTPLLAKALGEIGQLARAADLLRHQGEE